MSDNAVAIMYIVSSELGEQQRASLLQYLATRNITLHQYTYKLVKDATVEILHNARSTMDDPNVRPRAQHLRPKLRPHTFCIIDDGEVDGISGYWAEHDETGQVGFLPIEEDVFWVYDRVGSAWLTKI